MKPIHTHTFIVNPQENSGEQLSILTEFIPNGDPGVMFINTEITLQSYGNVASFHLCGAQLTPKILRQLADELENANEMATKKLVNLKKL